MERESFRQKVWLTLVLVEMLVDGDVVMEAGNGAFELRREAALRRFELRAALEAAESWSPSPSLSLSIRGGDETKTKTETETKS
jgi:hypothetical protein